MPPKIGGIVRAFTRTPLPRGKRVGMDFRRGLALCCAFLKAWTAAVSGILGVAKMSRDFSTAFSCFPTGFSSDREPSAWESFFSSAWEPSASGTSAWESFFVSVGKLPAKGLPEGNSLANATGPMEFLKDAKYLRIVLRLIGLP